MYYLFRFDFDFTVRYSIGYYASTVFLNLKSVSENKTYILSLWGSAHNFVSDTVLA